MIILILLSCVLLFGLVVFVGAPYVPTLKKQADTAVELLSLAPGDAIIELGCGDGRVVRRFAAAGYRVVGYELNPILVVVARLYTWRYRQQVTIVWGDYWHKEWPPAKGMYVFLLEKYMLKLDKKLEQYSKINGPINVVSYAFQIPKKRAKTSRAGLYLYKY